MFLGLSEGLMKLDWIDRIRKGGHVTRYHTHRCHHHGSVAEHSWSVAVMAGELWDEIYNDIVPPELYRYALLHDIAEFDTGDTPGWIKASQPELKTALDAVERTSNQQLGIDVPSPTIRDVVKAADKLDVCFWAYEEIRMGNQNALIVFVRNYMELDRWLMEKGGALAKIVGEIMIDLWCHQNRNDLERTKLMVLEHQDYFSKQGAVIK